MPQPPVAFSPFTFGAPALFWGLAAAAVPVLIHLLLRPRPRRQPFPAIRFILQSREAAERTNRLKRLILLAMRTLAVVLIVALLAQPRLRAARWISADAGPIAVAVCVDDSASMSYRFEGKTRVEAAVAWARSLVSDRSRFGEGSEFVVLTSGGGGAADAGETASLSTSRSDALRCIDAIVPKAHDLPVGAMVRRADERLRKARSPRREIYIFTDQTVRGWRDLSGPPMMPLSEAVVYCADVGVDEDRNASLFMSAVPRHPVTVNAPLRLDLSVCAGTACHLADDASVEVRVDGEPRLRVRLRDAGSASTRPGSAASSSLSVLLVLPGLPKGLHRLTAELTPADPLAWDNARFACVEVADLPRVAIVADDAASDSVAGLIAAMLAPSALSEDRQRVRVAFHKPGEVEAVSWAGYRCVFVADVPALGEAGWRALGAYARAGGVVVTILGSSVRPEGYADRGLLLPARPVRVVRMDAPTRLVASDFSRPLLEPFATPEVDSLSDRAVFQVWEVSEAAPGTSVLCTLATGATAIAERTVGLGRSFLMTFSPQREWSEFASQAAPMIVLLHRIVEIGSPSADAVAALAVGTTRTVTVKPGVAPVSLLVSGLSEGRSAPVRVNTTVAGGRVEIPTDSPGHVAVVPADRAGSPLFLFAVNVPEEESDLRRLPSEELIGRFSRGTATAAGSAAGLQAVQRRHRLGTDAIIPLGIVVLAILLVESAFANRFYRGATVQTASRVSAERSPL